MTARTHPAGIDDVDGFERDISHELRKKHLAKKVLDLRLDKGWTQDELAQRMSRVKPGISYDKTGISRYETAKSFPRPVAMQALAEVFGISVADLSPNPTTVEDRSNVPEFRINMRGESALVQVNRILSADTALEIAKLIREDIRRRGEAQE